MQCTIETFFVPVLITLKTTFKPSLYHGDSVNINSFEIGPKLSTGESNRRTTDRQVALLCRYLQVFMPYIIRKQDATDSSELKCKSDSGII